jgi:hypothetical protein
MEIESKHDDVQLTLARTHAEALLAAADDGLNPGSRDGQGDS